MTFEETSHLSTAKDPKAGILLLHDFFGLSDSVRTIAAHFAAQGFATLAPDMYEGEVTDSIPRARELSKALNIAELVARLRREGERVKSMGGGRVGIVGFSMGAGLAMHLAQQDTGAGAVIAYYGCEEVDASAWPCPLMGHFAESDEWTDPDEARRAFSAAQTSGHAVELHFYPETAHWFANADVPAAYDPAAAELATHRSLDFLRRYLAR